MQTLSSRRLGRGLLPRHGSTIPTRSRPVDADGGLTTSPDQSTGCCSGLVGIAERDGVRSSICCWRVPTRAYTRRRPHAEASSSQPTGHVAGELDLDRGGRKHPHRSNLPFEDRPTPCNRYLLQCVAALSYHRPFYQHLTRTWAVKGFRPQLQAIPNTLDIRQVSSQRATALVQLLSEYRSGGWADNYQAHAREHFECLEVARGKGCKSLPYDCGVVLTHPRAGSSTGVPVVRAPAARRPLPAGARARRARARSRRVGSRHAPDPSRRIAVAPQCAQQL
jgi:hypothetical protein